MKTFPKRNREIYIKYAEMTEEQHLDKSYVSALLEEEYELSKCSITRIVKEEKLKVAFEEANAKLEEHARNS